VVFRWMDPLSNPSRTIPIFGDIGRITVQDSRPCYLFSPVFSAVPRTFNQLPTVLRFCNIYALTSGTSRLEKQPSSLLARQPVTWTIRESTTVLKHSRFQGSVGKFCREYEAYRMRNKKGIKKREWRGSETPGIVTQSNSVLWRSPEPIQEASEPGTGGTRVGGTQPRLPPPSETNGATGKKQENKRNKCHPEARCGVGGEVGVV